MINSAALDYNVYHQLSFTYQLTDSFGDSSFGTVFVNLVQVTGTFDIAADTIANLKTYTGVIDSTTEVTKLGGGTLTLAGANTYTGTTSVNAGTLKIGATGSIADTPSITVASGAVFDVSEVAGGFRLGSGQTLRGTGNVVGPLTIGSGAELAPGTSPGTLTATGGETWEGGGNYIWELNSAAETGGVDPGWDFMAITGPLEITATSLNPFNIQITSLDLANALGNVSDFNNSADYSWTIASASEGITGFDPGAFYLDTSAFGNPFTGTFSLDSVGNDLILNYTAVPEPGSVALTALAALVFSSIRRRRRG